MSELATTKRDAIKGVAFLQAMAMSWVEATKATSSHGDEWRPDRLWQAAVVTKCDEMG